MSNRIFYKEVLEKHSGFTKKDLDHVENGIDIIKTNIKGPQHEAGVFINTSSRNIFSLEYLETLLKELKEKRKQIKNVLYPRSSQGSNGGDSKIKYGTQYYNVHIGSRGGKYILCKGKKLYI